MTVMGMDVKVRLLISGKHETETLHNVTEIHYGYPRPGGGSITRVAFESDIHKAGITYDTGMAVVPLELLEFEAKLATEIAEEF